MESESRPRIYKCPICTFESTKYAAIGGHMKGHKKKGAVQPAGEGGSASILQVKKRGPGRSRKVDVQSVILPNPEVLDPNEVAQILLKLVVDTINETKSHKNEVCRLKEEILDLELRLKKAVEERDRVVKVHNEFVRQNSNGQPVTIESILAAVRRDPKFAREH